MATFTKIIKIGDELHNEYLPNYSAANLERELTHIVNNIFSMKCYRINVPRRLILVSTPRFYGMKRSNWARVTTLLRRKSVSNDCDLTWQQRRLPSGQEHNFNTDLTPITFTMTKYRQ